jgi:hypothetical protein
MRVWLGCAALLMVVAGAWLLLEDGEVAGAGKPREISREHVVWGTIGGDPFTAAPASLQVRKCLERQKPLGKDIDILLGCRVDIASADLEPWMASFEGRLSPRPMITSLGALDLFEVDPAFTPVTAYAYRPVDDAKFLGVLLLVNDTRDGALLYNRTLLIND